MPAVQTSYSAMMQPALEGACATTLNDDNSDTRICETVAGIPFGRIVSEGTNARGAVLGGASGVIGLSILDRTLVSIFGGEVYRQGDATGVLFAGDMWVRVVAAVTHGAIATYDAITGQLDPVSGGIELYGSRYITSAGAGQIALLRLVSSASGEEGGDGSGALDWVPADALIHIDLVGGAPQGRAWVDGVGEVAIDTVIGADANTENYGFPTSAIDPNTELISDGFVAAHAIALIGSALDLVLAGCTLVMKHKNQALNPTNANAGLVSADGNYALRFDPSQFTLTADVPSPDLILTSGSFTGGAGDLNNMAVTFGPPTSEAAISTNGSPAVAGTIDGSNDWAPGGSPFVACFLFPDEQIALTSITIYSPQPVISLPDLSTTVTA